MIHDGVVWHAGIVCRSGWGMGWHSKQIGTDVRFYENEGSKDFKSMKKGVNWIENQRVN